MDNSKSVSRSEADSTISPKEKKVVRFQIKEEQEQASESDTVSIVESETSDSSKTRYVTVTSLHNINFHKNKVQSRTITTTCYYTTQMT